MVLQFELTCAGQPAKLSGMMRFGFPIFALTAALSAALIAGPVSAQLGDTLEDLRRDGVELPNILPEDQDGPATGLAEPEPEPEAKPLAPPKPAFELADTLDGLFNQLKRTADARRAERISKAIWAKWQTSDSASVDLLTVWARNASSSRKYAVALDLLDQVVVLRPEYAEGWNQRATLHFAMRNFSKSITDIERTLALEPRHYGALAGLAGMLTQLGREEEALETWYRALAVYPAMRSAQAAVLSLEEKLAGRGI
ncbi:hypothetical protein N9H93_01240 [Rhizobiaceae bacterium]|nr:hypothetical protein [Rhizobiaceae bacterium]